MSATAMLSRTDRLRFLLRRLEARMETADAAARLTLAVRAARVFAAWRVAVKAAA